MEKLGQTLQNKEDCLVKSGLEIRGPRRSKNYGPPGPRGNGAGPFQNDKIFDRTILNFRAKAMI